MKVATLFLALLLLPQHAAAFYKCSNTQGEISYQKAPCRAASTEKKVHVFIPKKRGEENGTAFTGGDAPVDQANDNQASAIILSNISAAIASLAPIKASSTQYYHLNGHWPKKLADIGINKKSVKSSRINSVRLDKNGRIVAQLNNSYGDNKKIILKPNIILGGSNMEWACYANFAKETLSSNNHAICESRNIH